MLIVTDHSLGKCCLWNANPQRPQHRPPWCPLQLKAGYHPDLAFLSDIRVVWISFGSLRKKNGEGSGSDRSVSGMPRSQRDQQAKMGLSMKGSPKNVTPKAERQEPPLEDLSGNRGLSPTLQTENQDDRNNRELVLI